MPLFCLVGNVVQKGFDIAENTGLNQTFVHVPWHENGFTRLSHGQQGCLQQARCTVDAIPAVVGVHGGCRVSLTLSDSPLCFEWSANLRQFR